MKIHRCAELWVEAHIEIGELGFFDVAPVFLEWGIAFLLFLVHSEEMQFAMLCIEVLNRERNDDAREFVVGDVEGFELGEKLGIEIDKEFVGQSAAFCSVGVSLMGGSIGKEHVVVAEVEAHHILRQAQHIVERVDVVVGEVERVDAEHREQRHLGQSLPAEVAVLNVAAQRESIQCL